MDESLNKPELQALAAAFDKLQEHVVITNERGVIVYANKAVERTTGYPLSEVLGKNPGQLWGGKMPKEFYATMWHYLNVEKKPFIGEVKNVHKDGTEYWQELHITPVVNESGVIRYYIAIEPEITERKKKEEYREEFFSIARHQIMNPLTKNNIILDLLLAHENVEKDKEQILQIYKDNLGIMDLINDLVFLGRPNNQKHYKENIDLANIIESAYTRVKETHPHITFIFNEEGSSFIFYTDEMLAGQVFYNIIANAAEYSSQDTGKITIVIKDTGTDYVLSCADNGIGIPADEQEEIFGKFYRASNARYTKSEGSGLGMYIVKTICDELGWKISFTSELEKGTTFTITMPKKITTLS